MELTANDYDEFDINRETTPVYIEWYCYTMERNQPVTMGNNGGIQSYFGFVIRPYCASTPAFCETNRAKDN